MLGEELIDPQTGESLGHDEKYCCDVVITRVQPKFSEGVLDNIQLDLTGVKPGKLQLREAMSVAKVSASQEEQGEKRSLHNAWCLLVVLIIVAVNILLVTSKRSLVRSNLRLVLLNKPFVRSNMCLVRPNKSFVRFNMRLVGFHKSFVRSNIRLV